MKEGGGGGGGGREEGHGGKHELVSDLCRVPL